MANNSNNMSNVAMMAALFGLVAMLSVVACFEEEELFQEGAPVKQFRRTLSHGGGGFSSEELRFSRMNQCFEFISEEELLDELTFRRSQRFHHRGSSSFSSSGSSFSSGGGHRGHIGLPVSQHQSGHLGGHRVPIHRGGLSAGGFEQEQAGVIGGSFEKEHEHDRASLNRKDLELGHIDGSFSDVGADNRKVFKSDSKSPLREKHITLEEDSSVHDKEGRFNGDILKAEKTRVNVDSDRSKSSGKLGAAGIKKTSGGFLETSKRR